MSRKTLAPRYSRLGITGLAFSVVLAAFSTYSSVLPQNPQLSERVAEIKQSAALNKQALAQYTWQEQQTISIKGDVKKQKQFLVRLGPDGKPQKTEIDPQAPTSGGRQRGLKHRVVEKKTGEYEDYAKQIAALAQSYAHPDPERLQQLFQQGSITFGPTGAPGVVQIIIRGYLKQADSLTLVFNTAQKALEGIQVASYLDTPQDAFTLSAQFARETGGLSHVSTMLVNGVSKQLTINTQNSNYQKM
jgi:hypothetical protein